MSISHTYKIHSDYPYNLLTPAYSCEPISSFQDPFPHSCLFVLFCDPLKTAEAFCVTIGLELSVKACLVSPTNRSTTEDSDSLVLQSPSVAQSSPGRGRAPWAPPKCISNCWELCPCVGLGQITTAVWVPDRKVCVMPRKWYFLALLSTFWFLHFLQPLFCHVPWALQEVVSTSWLGLSPQPVECPLRILH